MSAFAKSGHSFPLRSHFVRVRTCCDSVRALIQVLRIVTESIERSSAARETFVAAVGGDLRRYRSVTERRLHREGTRFRLHGGVRASVGLCRHTMRRPGKRTLDSRYRSAGGGGGNEHNNKHRGFHDGVLLGK